MRISQVVLSTMDESFVSGHGPHRAEVTVTTSEARALASVSGLTSNKPDNAPRLGRACRLGKGLGLCNCGDMLL